MIKMRITVETKNETALQRSQEIMTIGQSRISSHIYAIALSLLIFSK